MTPPSRQAQRVVCLLNVAARPAMIPPLSRPRSRPEMPRAPAAPPRPGAPPTAAPAGAAALVGPLVGARPSLGGPAVAVQAASQQPVWAEATAARAILPAAPAAPRCST